MDLLETLPARKQLSLEKNGGQKRLQVDIQQFFGGWP